MKAWERERRLLERLQEQGSLALTEACALTGHPSQRRGAILSCCRKRDWLSARTAACSFRKGGAEGLSAGNGDPESYG